jgi:hypothetical protein
LAFRDWRYSGEKLVTSYFVGGSNQAKLGTPASISQDDNFQSREDTAARKIDTNILRGSIFGFVNPLVLISDQK